MWFNVHKIVKLLKPYNVSCGSNDQRRQSIDGEIASIDTNNIENNSDRCDNLDFQEEETQDDSDRTNTEPLVKFLRSLSFVIIIVNRLSMIDIVHIYVYLWFLASIASNILA